MQWSACVFRVWNALHWCEKYWCQWCVEEWVSKSTHSRANLCPTTTKKERTVKVNPIIFQTLMFRAITALTFAFFVWTAVLLSQQRISRDIAAKCGSPVVERWVCNFIYQASTLVITGSHCEYELLFDHAIVTHLWSSFSWLPLFWIIRPR